MRSIKPNDAQYAEKLFLESLRRRVAWQAEEAARLRAASTAVAEPAELPRPAKLRAVA